MIVKRLDNEIIIPSATIKKCLSEGLTVKSVGDDMQNAISRCFEGNSKMMELINKVIVFATPFLEWSEGESLLIDILSGLPLTPTTTHEDYVHKLEHVLSHLHRVLDYSVYCASSKRRAYKIEKQWDCVSSTMPQWMHDNEVTKVSIVKQPIATSLPTVYLQYYTSALVFSFSDYALLNRNIVIQDASKGMTQGITPPAYSTDIDELMLEVDRFHTGALPACEKLRRLLGPLTDMDGTLLSDLILADALTSFKCMEEHKWSGYTAFLESIVSGLSSMLDYKVTSPVNHQQWSPFHETLSDFIAQHCQDTFTVTFEPAHSPSTELAYAILPKVLSRTDMASLSLPLPGFNIVERGCSTIKDDVDVYGYCG